MVLLLLPWVVALVLVRRHHHLDVGAVTILVSVSLGLPVIWLAWATYREATRSSAHAGKLSLAQVADQLAVAVGAQWETEAAVRRLNDPYPLPVSWVTADPSLADSWDSLVKLATSGAGWPAPSSTNTWAASPANLAGAGSDLVNVLAQVPTGRLVVLGEPGAGKTMLMVRLVLDLLTRRAPGGPVPILASIASWNPVEEDLRAWLGAQLLINYPALATPPLPGIQGPTQAAALLASGLILPILDGLDEIPEEVRGPAVSRINDVLRPGEQLVVTCRIDQYREAIRPTNGIEVTLRAGTAVELCPLDADAVRKYLCDDAGGPAAKARWKPVFAMLGTNVPVGQALTTPLMVGLARAVYNPRPGELAGALRKPRELCDADLADRKAVETVLFDAFVPAAYRHDTADRWSAQDAEKWLGFLARHLDRTIIGPDLAWWQLWLAIPGFRRWLALVGGVVIGAMTGLVAGAVDDVTGGVVLGALTGIATGVGATTRWSPKPVRGVRWQRPSRSTVIVAALAGIVLATLAGAIAGTANLVIDVEAGILLTIVTAIIIGFPGWILEQKGVPLDASSAMSPSAVLAQDRGAGAILWGLTAAAFIFPVWFLVGVLRGLVAGILIGATAGVIMGALVSFAEAAWPSFMVARGWLALRHQLPWRLMPFLADAHRRGVLRQAGAVYQFRHIELQHRLATRPTKSAGVPGAPGSGSAV